MKKVVRNWKLHENNDNPESEILNSADIHEILVVTEEIEKDKLARIELAMKVEVDKWKDEEVFEEVLDVG